MLKRNLYIALLGGKHAHANVEVHDVIPVICTDIYAAFPYLKQRWFGLASGLHLDAWMKIDGVSYQGINYKIEIQPTAPVNQTLKLFLVNLGAYLPNQFGEIHKYLIVAGKDKADAKVQGKLAIEQQWFKPHTDAIVDVDDCLELNMFSQDFIHLLEADFEDNIYKNDYVLIK
ncbi:DUF1543 domain-containing protein [Acinetobacter sp. MD2(2019)]|nr:DUF1543 domain-containing protein [Acinetobacter sp. MD2(2019)]